MKIDAGAKLSTGTLRHAPQQRQCCCDEQLADHQRRHPETSDATATIPALSPSMLSRN